MTLQKWVQIAAFMVIEVVTSSICTADGTVQKKMDPKNKEVLGITLGTSSVDDVQHILGPATETGIHQGELTQLCYVSSKSDRTVLQFVIWSKPVGFRIFHGSPQDLATCSKSTRVTATLATKGGLRLGMRQRQVIALLGRPTKVEGKKLIYDFSHDRPLTADEEKQVDRNDPMYRSIDAVGVSEKIELDFARSTVSRVDVTFSETY